MSGHPPLVVVAGATATGKTELAIRLAEASDADGRTAVVISADSRQVYRGLDIGTAKASPADQARAPHHGLDLVDPDQPFTVADFQAHVRDVLAATAMADGIAILAGGTGFWLRAVAAGLDTDTLPSDPELRRSLEAQAATEGLAPLLARLDRIAPTAAARVDRRNPRRVVRALEIAESVGDVPRPPFRGYDGPLTWVGLDVERTTHDVRIHRRAQGQFDAGLIDEAVALRARFDPGLPAFSAIGYREAWSVVDGALTLAQAVDLDARRNIAFARRQRTWFRAESAITWFDATGGLPVEAIREHIRLSFRDAH